MKATNLPVGILVNFASEKANFRRIEKPIPLLTPMRQRSNSHRVSSMLGSNIIHENRHAFHNFCQKVRYPDILSVRQSICSSSRAGTLLAQETQLMEVCVCPDAMIDL